MTKDHLVSQLQKVADYIEQHADEPLPLKALAEEVGFSPFYLQRQFKALFGVSPKEYQNALRIKKLKSALREGDEITGAIYEAGFGSTSRVYEQTDGRLGMTLSSYRSGGKGETISYAIRTTILGPMIMAATDRGVCFISFQDKEDNLLPALKQEYPYANLIAASASPDLNLWMQALNDYIAQKTPYPNIPLHLNGTAFQMRVWKFLTRIPEGKTATYTEIAKGVGTPKAVRAVANACASNNVAVLIPCHRVLRSDGKLGGYRWGLARKAALLKKEQQYLTL